MSNRKAVLIFGGIVLVAIVVGVLCIGWMRQPTVPPTTPYETPQPIQGEEGVDWEDCFNNEPDCFLGRRKLVPTTAPKVTRPTTVPTGRQPAPVRTTRRR